jgi:predicted peptidase
MTRKMAGLISAAWNYKTTKIWSVMKYYHLVLFFCMGISVFPAQAQRSVEAKAGQFNTIRQASTDGAIDGFILYLPISYEKSRQRYPVILFLHGAGAIPRELELLKEHALTQLILDDAVSSELKSYLTDSFVVVCPHLTKNGQFYDQVLAIKQILNDVSTNFRTDPNRVYITGFSRGGHGTWGLAAKMKDTFAAAVPICGRGHGVDDYANLKELPIWTAHNTGDPIVGYDETIEIVKQIEQASGASFYPIPTTDASKTDYLSQKRIFRSFKQDGHDAWTEMYNKVELYKWLLKQRKPSRQTHVE